MYRISDEQIDYIINDIRARGVDMESLQQNLLDHMCCVIEQNLKEGEDFEKFYQTTIKTFYKEALWEIEEETIQLLTFKNYYKMKKIMISSGIFSAITLSVGILFKFMHWPGAAICILLGIVSASFIFMPLMFTLKAKEKQHTKDKLVIGIGALAATLISLSTLFKVMHWPYANLLGTVSVVIMLALFLPIYFFSGIQKPETKVNTMTSSILIILGCGLVLTLIRTPRSSMLMEIKNTHDFMRSQQILKTEQSQLQPFRTTESIPLPQIDLGNSIYTICENLKSYILKLETGYSFIDKDFQNKQIAINEHTFGSNPFQGNPNLVSEFAKLTELINNYNSLLLLKNNSEIKQIPVKTTFVEYFNRGEAGLVSNLGLLNQLTQFQMFVLQNKRELISLK